MANGGVELRKDVLDEVVENDGFEKGEKEGVDWEVWVTLGLLEDVVDRATSAPASEG